jgi:AcrR family transcriptional regulator
MKQKTREKITDVAMNLFSKNGYQNTSVDMIIKKAKVSKGLMFYHFHTKEGLLNEILSSALEKINFIINEDNSMDDSKSRLTRIIDNFMLSLEKDYDFWRLYASLVHQKNLKDQFCIIDNGFFDKCMVILIDIFKKYYKENYDPAKLMEFEIVRRGVYLSYILEHDKTQVDFYKRLLNSFL